MSRLSRFLLLLLLLVVGLACNAVTQPIKNVQNVASTAQSMATDMPNAVSTLQAVATNIPMSTLEALPSSMPAIETALPNVEGMFNPQGKPVDTWNNIPIMTDATQGQEFSSTSYSFATPSTATQVQDFYNSKMKDLGWSSMFGSQVSDQGGLLIFQKDKALLTMTIVANPNGDKGVVVNFQLVNQ